MDLKNPKYFNNRELSWLKFNDRVLETGREKNVPLLERLRFLGITESNLDEFVNVRVASLKKMQSVHYTKPDAAGFTPNEQLRLISAGVHELVEKQYNTLNRSLLPKLAESDVKIIDFCDLTSLQLTFVEDYFHTELFPVLTPMAVDVSRPFPFIANDVLNIAIRLQKGKDDNKDKSFATVQVPDVFPRVLKLPGEKNHFILLEEIITGFMAELFTGFEVKETGCYRVIRDMDLDVEEEDASDLLKEIQQQLKLRERGKPLMLEIDGSMSKHLKKRLAKALVLTEDEIYEIKGPIDLTFLSQLIKQVNGHDDLLYAPFTPFIQKRLLNTDYFAEIRKSDLFLHHPYDSFEPVINFIKQAAEDSEVLAIKMTLYRVSGKSPIIKYLKQAANNGKQVTVLVELKARFDEENNVHWAKELEKAGCHVIYGLVGLKTHCKLTLVVRRDEDGIRRYMHMATGNYNDVTARVYTDMGLFTADSEMGIDASNIFNMLSGFSEPPYFNKLNIAPLNLREFLLARIDDEIEQVKAGKKGFIQMKMNSLSDTEMIEKLYEAAATGVKINLIIRGICNLKTGIKGVSENIEVHSIVGRFLEHSRIYYFYAAGEEKVFLASADLMNRNLSRRVELIFPILQEDIKQQVIRLYTLMWSDNVNTRVMQNDGTYQKVDRRGLVALDVQAYLLEHAREIGTFLDPEETLTVPKHHNHQFMPITQQNDTLD